MLEIRDVSKVYRAKTGEQVRALDHISVTFPESGMIFILGKSGSGKSTLLNIIGGLDSLDEGEFIIRGKSSKDFAGSDFDAYRNTFIGFIFQEYNVLDDFTVGANIALALELQGKKATPEAIDAILSQVDLVNFAHRKPNELSGGQKQRVAIARALVKEPQIIMADEPTGALDSNTGRQIFDTLKSLSREKLVLVVSHDRDFAERYADRIIELQDGHIISDVTRHEVEGQRLSAGIRRMSDHLLRVEGGYQLTPEDVEMINAYLRNNRQGLLISGDTRVNETVRAAAGMTEGGNTSVFSATDAGKDVSTRAYAAEESRFIRSRLPMKNALKIGGSGLKHKKFRLVMTILLSLVAFSMFGLADTMAAYNKVTAATESILDSHVRNASMTLGVRTTYYYGRDGEESSTYWQPDTMNDDDIETLRRDTGLDFVPVYNDDSSSLTLGDMMPSVETSTAYTARLYGFVPLDETLRANLGFPLTGRLPERPGEIVLTEFLYRQFNENGFKNDAWGEEVRAGELTMSESGEKSLIGKHLTLTVRSNWTGEEEYDWVTRNENGSIQLNFTVVGILDTGFDYTRYARFLPSGDRPDNTGTDLGTLNVGDLLLSIELSEELNYGFHALGFSNAEAIQIMAANIPRTRREALGEDLIMQSELSTGAPSRNTDELYRNGVPFYRAGGSSLIPKLSVRWLDGTPRTQLGENELLVSISFLDSIAEQLGMIQPDTTALEARLGEIYGEAFTNAKGTLRDRVSAADPAGTHDAELAAALAAFLDLPADDLSANAQTVLVEMLKAWGSEGLDYWTIYNARLKVAQEGAGSFASDTADYKLTMETLDLIYGWSGSSLDEQLGAYHLYAYDQQYYDDVTDAAILQTVVEMKDCRIVGFFEYDDYFLVINDTFLSKYQDWIAASGYYGSRVDTAPHESGIWAFAVAPMPTDAAGVRRLVEYHYQTGDLNFEMRNQVMSTLDSFNEFIEIGAKVFLYIGIGFAVFSALLLMNFIAISISYKKREIGILRAVGARSSDVFKIFFSEALMIALINFALAIAATLGGITIINRVLRSEGINVTLLHFGPRQVALMLLVSVAVALIASFLPVWRIARKKPVDAIKDR